MTLNNALKATGRSLRLQLFAWRYASVHGLLRLAPRSSLRADFSSPKDPSSRTRFTINAPVRDKLQTPDGEMVIYRWGDVDRKPTVVLVHGWNGWAQQMEHSSRRCKRAVSPY